MASRFNVLSLYNRKDFVFIFKPIALTTTPLWYKFRVKFIFKTFAGYIPPNLMKI